MPIQGEEDKDTDASPTYRGFLDLIISRSLILACVMISFAFELLAAYSYFRYWPCSKIVGRCSPAGAFSWLPLSIAWIVGQAFCIVDIVLLFASIFVVEIVAIINYLLCPIFAFSHEVGKNVHRMTRKLPHHARWAFRHNFECYDPPRLHFKNYLGDSRTN